MLRRKLALYTLIYIAGITAGFFMFEKARIPEAAGFCAAVICAVRFTDRSSAAGAFPGKKRDNNSSYMEKHNNFSKEVIERQKIVLAVFFLAGFLLFTVRYMSYNSALSYIHDKNYVRGKVISVSVKEDKLRLIIKNEEIGPEKVLVTMDESAAERLSEEYGYSGAVIEARGKYSSLPPADDPGCFDYGLYMKSRGVNISFRAYIIEFTDEDVSPVTKVKRYLYRCREAFIGRFSSDKQGFIRGVIFGDKSEIDEEVLEEFNNNSTGHILAVSGLHMGFLYGLLRFLTARRRTLSVSILIISVVLLYGEMTDWSPATVRACIVMTVSLFSAHIRRCSDLLTSISLAAFLILTYQPYQLFSSGFQLSFLALCGIAFFTRPISSVTGEALAVMIAVQIGTLPVIAYTYCRINPLSILINIPVIMLASVLVPLCILMLMMEAAAGRVPSAGIDLAELISFSVVKINHLLSFGGSFSINTAGPGIAVTVLVYVFLFGIASEWARVMMLRKDLKAVIKQGIIIIMPLAMLFSCIYDPISDDEIVFVSVGQGDCVHIRAEGHDVLIDGGGQGEGYNVGKSILMPYLVHGGADAVDIALVTHLHTDHYKGIEELSEEFPVGAIGIPVDYREASDEKNTHAYNDSSSYNNGKKYILNSESEIHYIAPDTKIDVSDDVNIEVIWPVEVSDEPLAADDPNEHNTVYMVNYKGKKIMVTGDLLEADEQDMVEYYQGTDTLKCDILKVAHHGSKSSSSEAFLDAANPDIAVIQCGLNNFYGHPHKQTLGRLQERGIKVFRTDQSGAVGIDIHRSRIAIDLFRKEHKQSL